MVVLTDLRSMTELLTPSVRGRRFITKPFSCRGHRMPDDAKKDANAYVNTVVMFLTAQCIPNTIIYKIEQSCLIYSPANVLNLECSRHNFVDKYFILEETDIPCFLYTKCRSILRPKLSDNGHSNVQFMYDRWCY